MRQGKLKNAVLIAGPTASGKSRLALKIAAEEGGVIVNADSMQVYCLLDVLTARPGADELAAAPHRLYGHVHPAQAYSAGEWLRDVRRLAEQGEFRSRRPIFVGGTGLYFRALTEGLSEMPEIPRLVRDRWRHRLGQQGPDRLYRLLLREDRAAALMLRPSDGQRIVRALEVLDASGRSILEWQGERGVPLVDIDSARALVLEPDRQWLARRIEQRLAQMVAAGAAEEVRALLAIDLDPAMPAMKAIGVRELEAALRGEIAMGDALTQAAAATRQYAKRQMTWFRNQMGAEWRRIPVPAGIAASAEGTDGL